MSFLRRFKLTILLWGILFFVFESSTVLAENTEDAFKDTLYARAAVLMDAESGRVLWGKNADEILPMASTTKILTCILTLENVGLDEEVTISSYATTMPKVKLGVRKGEKYTVRNMLYSLMLESHNDAAVVLAEYVGKQYVEGLADRLQSDFTVSESKAAVDAFAGLMNQKAEEIGCENSYFITPNGLDAEKEVLNEYGEIDVKQHSTTAKDLALIMSYCIGKSSEKDTFLTVTRTKEYSFQANGRRMTVVNHNSFLSMMEGALSGKTGFTNKAGYCYVGSLQREGRTFVVALLACGWPNHKNWKWSDTRKLMQFGLDHYEYHSFAEDRMTFDESNLHPIPVKNGRYNELGKLYEMPIELAKDVHDEKMTGEIHGESFEKDDSNGLSGMLLALNEEVEVNCQIMNMLKAPVRQGTTVGWVIYAVDGVEYRRDRIVSKGEIGAIDFLWCLQQVSLRFFL